MHLFDTNDIAVEVMWLICITADDVYFHVCIRSNFDQYNNSITQKSRKNAVV